MEMIAYVAFQRPHGKSAKEIVELGTKKLTCSNEDITSAWFIISIQNNIQKSKKYTSKERYFRNIENQKILECLQYRDGPQKSTYFKSIQIQLKTFEVDPTMEGDI